MLHIFYEQKRDRYKCVIRGKFIGSSLDYDKVVGMRDDYLKENGLTLAPIGVSKHPGGHFIYRRNFNGVRYEIYTSMNEEEVLRAKEIFDGRIQSKEISIPQIESITDNGDEPDRRKVRGIAKDSAEIWGDNLVFIREGKA